MIRLRKYTIVAAMALIGLVSTDHSSIHADEMNDDVMAVTVVLIYKTAGFFTWPDECFETNDSELVIGVYGSKKLTSELRKATRGRDVQGHPVKVVEVEDLTLADHIHALFIAGDEVPEFARIPDEEKDVHPVLTISESPDTMEGGGILRIYIKDNKPKLQLNVDAARRRQLNVKSDLLKVAEVFREKEDS